MALRDLILKASGPLAVVYACPLCSKHSVRISKGTRGTGRGHGLALGSMARADVIKHMKAAHPELLTEAQAVYDATWTELRHKKDVWQDRAHADAQKAVVAWVRRRAPTA